jgi:Bacterial protein of unknown function (DUF885)
MLRPSSFLLLLATLACPWLSSSLAQGESKGKPELSPRELAETYAADRELVARRHLAGFSAEGRQARLALARRLLSQADKLRAAERSVEDHTDLLLLANRSLRDLAAEALEESREKEIQALLGRVVTRIVGLEEQRRRFDFAEARVVAKSLDEIVKELRDLRQKLAKGGFAKFDAVKGRRAVTALREAERVMRAYCRFREDYDPDFGWWTKKPREALLRELRDYAAATQKTLVLSAAEGEAPLVGEAVGEEGLKRALAFAFIPYSPAELIEIAHREFAWCDAEMERATKEMGCAHWREAQDKVKELHVAPGEQIDLIRDLAYEAIDFLEKRDLVTIPALCRDGWRMSMLSPEAQRVSPYFLGGEVIQVSYPTHDMSHDEKLMSMRGNNPHFSRATVQHELIPGHHLQGFMTRRHRPHRRLFNTPFWVEGWALYWEMRLWELDFPRGPEDRIGMLFWRKHRCARIIFSLGFHSGTMTAQECVDFLIERVGHEASAAEAEVRRSINGSYPPLYQAAYMLGGLQIRRLHRELVVEGGMSERDFHDAILQRNAIPIELLRAELKGEKLPMKHRAKWRFYD